MAEEVAYDSSREPRSDRPSVPWFIYDGDCGFCRRWIDRCKPRTGDRVAYAPYQSAGRLFPSVSTEAFRRAAHLIEPGGTVTMGAEAVFLLLSFMPRGGLYLWMYRRVPGFRFVSELGYRFVASQRPMLSRITNLLTRSKDDASRWVLSRWLFLRMLGVVYFVAFVSLWVQVEGLIGSNGILPVADYLDAASRQLGGARFAQFPTLCWFNASDGFLHFLCGGGALLSILLILGIAPVPVLALLWLMYLSLQTAGGAFLSFQWDVLLLETGLLAIFFAPMGLWPSIARERKPSSAMLLLLRLLLFKLMFLSGVVKFTSGDHTWRDLTALQFHFETQPIPAWTSWYAHHLPAWFLAISVALAYAIEILVPFLIFRPGRIRRFAGLVIIAFQVLIAATGNYGFFNLLTIALCIPLLDDALLARVLPRRRREALGQPTRGRESAIKRLVVAGVVAVILPLSLIRFVAEFGLVDLRNGRLAGVWRWVQPLGSVNGYGLFRVMTTTRPEIVIEGTHDGREWKAYSFHYKPGDVNRRPVFVAPHMPRLDWQMWFAALRPPGRPPGWFMNFMGRLLQGSPQVLALMEHNPFPDHPPRAVRAILYDYHFSDSALPGEDGAWWHREVIGPYSPTLSLRSR